MKTLHIDLSSNDFYILLIRYTDFDISILDKLLKKLNNTSLKKIIHKYFSCKSINWENIEFWAQNKDLDVTDTLAEIIVLFTGDYIQKKYELEHKPLTIVELNKYIVALDLERRLKGKITKLLKNKYFTYINSQFSSNKLDALKVFLNNYRLCSNIKNLKNILRKFKIIQLFKTQKISYEDLSDLLKIAKFKNNKHFNRFIELLDTSDGLKIKEDIESLFPRDKIDHLKKMVTCGHGIYVTRWSVYWGITLTGIHKELSALEDRSFSKSFNRILRQLEGIKTFCFLNTMKSIKSIKSNLDDKKLFSYQNLSSIFAKENDNWTIFNNNNFSLCNYVNTSIAEGILDTSHLKRHRTIPDVSFSIKRWGNESYAVPVVRPSKFLTKEELARKFQTKGYQRKGKGEATEECQKDFCSIINLIRENPIIRNILDSTKNQEKFSLLLDTMVKISDPLVPIEIYNNEANISPLLKSIEEDENLRRIIGFLKYHEKADEILEKILTISSLNELIDSIYHISNSYFIQFLKETKSIEQTLKKVREIPYLKTVLKLSMQGISIKGIKEIWNDQGLLKQILKAIKENYVPINKLLGFIYKYMVDKETGKVQNMYLLSEQAKIVSFLSAMLKDLSPYDYKLYDQRYINIQLQVMKIFDIKEANTIPFGTRLEVAKTLGCSGDPRIQVDSFIHFGSSKFHMGAQPFSQMEPNFDKLASPCEAPVHIVELSPHNIAKFPVTVGEFKQFLDEFGYEKEEYWQRGGFKEWNNPLEWEKQLEIPNCPVVGISWYEAMAYVPVGGNVHYRVRHNGNMLLKKEVRDINDFPGVTN